MIDVAHLLADGPVAVQEYADAVRIVNGGGAQHDSPSDFRMNGFILLQLGKSFRKNEPKDHGKLTQGKGGESQESTSGCQRILPPWLSILTVLFPPRLQHPVRLFEDLVNTHSGHTAMVDRTFSQKARTAFNPFLQHNSLGTERSSGKFICRTKNGERGDPNRRCEVHRAGVISYKEVAEGNHRDQFRELESSP